ncbi:hypothetical protein BDF20DRAFT_832040 [Mycotypha africana]|uniref:uncharacterized protein n=1 Tax=Mycotypha africana TaxID=64632 RepID=UPI0023003C89|nr:uncharacterized protein BDF20DRAFT_832040 [Mycotypha africana]KAI8992053.1 hypothetical protein BDF20DRAFT_832040 [Mycotypha africana]
MRMIKHAAFCDISRIPINRISLCSDLKDLILYRNNGRPSIPIGIFTVKIFKLGTGRTNSLPNDLQVQEMAQMTLLWTKRESTWILRNSNFHRIRNTSVVHARPWRIVSLCSHSRYLEDFMRFIQESREDYIRIGFMLLHYALCALLMAMNDCLFA